MSIEEVFPVGNGRDDIEVVIRKDDSRQRAVRDRVNREMYPEKFS